MPMVQEFWKKLNSNEKMVMYGAIIVVIAFLVSLTGGGLGSYAQGDIVAAVIIGVIYWLKYSPNKITWPLPVQTLVLAIAGISAVAAALGLLVAFAYIGTLWGIATLINAVGCGLMGYYAWLEYQAMPKAAPPAAPPTTPPAA